MDELLNRLAAGVPGGGWREWVDKSLGVSCQPPANSWTVAVDKKAGPLIETEYYQKLCEQCEVGESLVEQEIVCYT